MGNQVSPGIQVREFNLDLVVPSVSTTTGAAAGVFRWGPVGERVLIDNEQHLASRFGTPTSFNAETWFSISSFLAYGAPSWVVRGANTTTTNAAISTLSALANTTSVANVIAQTVLNDDDYLHKDGTFDSAVEYVARYPGAIGNSLRISSVFTANAFTSVINLATYGTAGATLNINVGANAAVITLNAASVTLANSNASTILSLLSVSDLLAFGNSQIGKQNIQVSATPTVNSQGNTTTGNTTITIPLAEFLSLYSSWSSNTTLTRYWEFYPLVGKPPGQSQYQLNNGNVSANDELHLVVVDEDGLFTGVPGEVLEVYRALSRSTDAVGLDNGSIYYKTVINQQSAYIRWTNDNASAVSNTAVNQVSSSLQSVLDINLAGGTDGASEANVAVGDIARAWNFYLSKEDVDISLIITGKGIGGIDGEQITNYIVDNIAEPRMDCVVYASPSITDVVNNKGNELTAVSAYNTFLRDSSYLFVDTGYKLMYDIYNDVNRWIPLNGDMAGLTARTDYTNDPWWAPAGFNRGTLKNVVKLAYSPPHPDRDVLYPVGVNPVVTFKAQGTVLYGNRTRLNVVSAFQDLNIRRLFIVLEKAIAEMAQAFLFEFNDAFTRAQFVNTVTPYLRDIQGRRGIVRFLVRCDETNNTEEVVRQDRFVGDLIIQPNRAIAFISLNFVAVGASVTFSEIESQNIQFG